MSYGVTNRGLDVEISPPAHAIGALRHRRFADREPSNRYQFRQDQQGGRCHQDHIFMTSWMASRKISRRSAKIAVGIIGDGPGDLCVGGSRRPNLPLSNGDSASRRAVVVVCGGRPLIPRHRWGCSLCLCGAVSAIMSRSHLTTEPLSWK